MTIGFKDALNQQMMMNNQPGFSDNIAEAFTKAGSQNANGPAQQANNAFLSGIGAGFKGSADNRRQAKIDSYFQKAGEITAKAAELEAQMQMAQDYQLKTNEFARMNTPLIAEFASAVDQNDPRANLMFKTLVKKASIIPGFENLEAEDWNPTGGYGLALNTQTGEYRKISADDIIGVIAPQAQQLYGDTWFEKFTPLNGGFAKNLKDQFNKQQQNQNLDMAYKEAGINNLNAKTNSEKLNMQALQQQMNNPTRQLSDIDKFNLQETRKSNEGFLKDLQSEVAKKDPQTKITVLNRLEEILKSGEAGIGNTPKDKIARWVKKNYGTDANIQEAKMLQKYMFGDIKGVAGNPNAKEWEDLTSRLISGEQNINAALNVLNFEKQQSENLLNNYNNYRQAISETNNEIPYYDPRIDEVINKKKNQIEIYSPQTDGAGTVAAQDQESYPNKSYQQEQDQKPTIGNRISSAAKSVVSGVAGAIPDTLSLPYNLAASAFNSAKQNNMPIGDPELVNPEEFNNRDLPDIPYIPSATNAINNKIDRATGGYTKTPEDQKYLNTALEAGGGFAAGGIASKSAGMLGKVGSFTGTTKPGQIAGAGIGAAVTEKQLNEGSSTGSAIGTGILANTSINALSNLNPKNIGRQIAKTGLNTIGLGEKNLNIEAAKAFKDLGLGDIPKATVSDAKSIALAEQILSKTPFAGEAIQKKYYKIGPTVTQLLNDASDSIEPGIIQKVKDLSLENRKRAAELLKDTDVTKPSKVIDTINKIQAQAKLVSSPTPQEKQVINIIDDYKKAYEGKGKVSVKGLILSQDSLGNIVDWDWLNKQKPLRWQREIYKAFGEDINNFGKNSKPEWLEYYTKADQLYNKALKKVELEKLFEPATNKATGELSFNNLSKILNDDKKVAKLKNLLGTDENAKTIFNKLEKLGTVARSISVKNKNIPNPSGTAVVSANIKFIDNIITGALGAGAFIAPGQTAVSVLGVAGITKLLTNEKLLDLAIKFAENPIPRTAVPLSNKVKELTGYNIISSFKEAQKQTSQDDNINEEELKPAQGLNNLMKKINNNKPIKSFLQQF